ncbi:MAG: hypothetical protein A3G18_09770 [Rhodospirillales bacterium RIFCSPLOWO2_12_FULL_58_28]|nr:MAG: hypothetical protein A3H92_06140 [Rhodospirillales bacterium RIFCSPLOWO2_02_FULL_58_16]OHC78785.1 MAG: hypothetical protein A3G18_09770 [Rhodospirillales bacterium RIFCSPLOWO2_12_FULL_58_28]
MIKLGNREPAWLSLADGVRLKVRPITTPAYAMIQAQAEKVFDDWAEHRAESENLDPANESVRRGLMRALMIKGLALYAVIEWQGINAPVSDETVAAFIDEHPLLAALFYHRYLAPLEDRAAEGNASGPAPHGISAAGRDIAEAAEKADSPAATPVLIAITSP